MVTDPINNGVTLAPDDDFQPAVQPLSEYQTPATQPTPAPVTGRRVHFSEYALQAERKRREDYDSAREAVWNGEPLQPYSRARESLLVRLIELDVPSSDLDDLSYYAAHLDAYMAENPNAVRQSIGELADLSSYLPTAAKLLFLCAHPAEAFDSLRGKPGKFIRAIEDWAEKNIRPEQIEEACWLAMRMRYAHRSVMAMHRPQKGDGRAHEGN